MKSRITLVVTFFFLLSLLLVSALQLYYVKAEMKTVLADQQQTFVTRVADDLDQKLRTNLGFIVMGAGALPSEAIQDIDRLDAWMAQRQGLRVVFSDLFVISTKGVVLLDAPSQGRRGLDVSDREYVRTTIETRKPFISKPVLGKGSKEPIVSFSAPVLDNDGTVVAILTGTLRLLQTNFLGNLAEAKVGKTGSFAVFTQDRTIVISSDESRILTQGPTPGISPYFDRATSGVEGSEEAVNSRGLRAIFSYSPLETVPWALVASLPIEEAYAPIQATQRRIAHTTLLLGLLVAPLVWLAVRRLYDPLRMALHEREAGLQRAQSMAKLAHVITARDGDFVNWSATMPRLVGVAPEQMPKSTREWLSYVHPDDRAQFRARSIEAGVTRQRTDQQYRLQRPDGTSVEILQTMEPIEQPGADGKSRWFNTLQDITEQKHAEAKIGSLNRMHAVLSGINSLIVRVNDRDELFRESCRLAIEHGHFKTALIGLVDPSAKKMQLAALAGLKPDFLAPFDEGFPLKDDSPLRNTLIARVAREKQPIVSNDMRSDPATSFTKESVELGICSIAVLPLVVSDRVIGVVALFAGEPGYFDDGEMRLLMELAGDISFALDHIDKAERLDYLAYYDALTGLANRRLFLERLDERLLAARKAEGRLSVTVLDIERLQSVNDAFGRQAGDQLLKEVAGRLTSLRGDATRLARIGSETFAVVSANVQNESEVARMTEHKLQACFDPPFRIGAQELRIPAKAGIAMYLSDGDDAESLLRCAESALKRAKSHDDRYLFFEPKMTERIAERLALEDELRQAVEKQEFVLFYQPKVDLTDRRIVGVEALIRWRSPARGLVPPLHFIPLLEETGLILQVGTWALERAALDYRRWTEQNLQAPRVAVNVSSVQLRQKNFVEVVEASIGIGVDQPGIDLEVTESLVIEDIAGSVEKLKALRTLGLGIALDDFGTGYSSLAYLARLPIEALKIDRSFIILMHKDADTMTLVKTIISMAHSLRLKVIAEGVETEEQAATLLHLNCDQMQGYLISRPVAFEEMTALLAQRMKS